MQDIIRAKDEALKVIEKARQAALVVIAESEKKAVAKEHKLLETVISKFDAHAEDDKKQFGEIKALQQIHEEVSRVNGETMATVKLDVKEVKDMLLDQNSVQKQSDKKLNENIEIWNQHIEAVAPILKRYEDEQAAKRVLRGYLKGATGTGAAIGAWYIIKKFFLE